MGGTVGAQIPQLATSWFDRTLELRVMTNNFWPAGRRKIEAPISI